MVFEVDNTTEQLIKRLQASIQDTIYDGQREIKELIDEVKRSYSSLATADQADAVSEDVSKAKAAIQRLATAEQAEQIDAHQKKLLGLVEQDVQNTAEIKIALPDMTKYSMEQLQALSDKLEALSSDLDTKLDKLFAETSVVLTTAEANKSMLVAIGNYLSLPGYKRLFKGMEVLEGETDQ